MDTKSSFSSSSFAFTESIRIDVLAEGSIDTRQAFSIELAIASTADRQKANQRCCMHDRWDQKTRDSMWQLEINFFSSLILTTEICCNVEVDEVEIFSLIEEQIPKYRIRADNITSFAGTSNQDFEFVQFPALNVPENINLGLTSDQARETLNYFCKYWNTNRHSHNTASF